MIDVVASLVAVVTSSVLSLRVLNQYRRRGRPYQLAWAVALVLFALAAACQFYGQIAGWSPDLYRLWYLSGAILAAAYLGQGELYLFAPRRVADATSVVLLLASVYAVLAVRQAPIDLGLALSGGVASGLGMPPGVRLLTPFLNGYGTTVLLGGVIRSVSSFLWNGGSGQRAMGTGLIGAGAVVVAAGGTLARLGIPGVLYSAEAAGIVMIYTGFVLTTRPTTPSVLSPSLLARRRRTIVRVGVGLGATTLFSLVIALPILPWTMGIVTAAKHVYIASVPASNPGAYLVTRQGVMELFAWYVEPPTFPSDAPDLFAGDVREVVVVQKQFDPPDRYRLYRFDDHTAITWRSAIRHGEQLTLVPAVPLRAGSYVLLRPTDSMYGGETFHYFRLK